MGVSMKRIAPRRPLYRRHWRPFRTGAGRRPAYDFLHTQTLEDYTKIIAAMTDVADYGLAMAKHLRGEIWEVRADGLNQTFRVLFAPEGHFGQVLLALDAFSKKKQKTPPRMIDLAETRLADWRRRGDK